MLNHHIHIDKSSFVYRLTRLSHAQKSTTDLKTFNLQWCRVSNCGPFLFYVGFVSISVPSIHRLNGSLKTYKPPALPNKPYNTQIYK